MDRRMALHTASRRYILERLGDGRPGGGWMLDERLAGILRRIELVRPEDFQSVDELRAYLIEAARMGSLRQDTWQRKFLQEVDAEHAAADLEERSAFVAYLEGLDETALNAVEPLPYRRMLKESEAERLWHRMRRKWQMPSDTYMWYPMVDGGPPPPHVRAFHYSDFLEHVPVSLLQDWLREHRARPLYELGDIDLEAEMDIEFFDAEGHEVYWTSPKMDWVLYSSHEYSMTVGGDWLLTLVARQWPESREHLRTSHLPYKYNEHGGIEPA